jgi:hypothetical protein
MQVVNLSSDSISAIIGARNDSEGRNKLSEVNRLLGVGKQNVH